MVIQNKFQAAGGTILSSGTQTEIATGIGVAKFYAGDFSASNKLSDAPTYANIGAIYTDTVSAMDVDFDLEVKRSMIIDGEGIVSFNLGIGNSSGSNADPGNVTITAIIRKWDGTTETDLVTGTETIDVGTIGGNQTTQHIGSINLTIPRTKFAQGDTLRLTITIPAVGGSFHKVLVCDPKNRDVLDRIGEVIVGFSAPTSWNTTELILLTPIVIDIP